MVKVEVLSEPAQALCHELESAGPQVKAWGSRWQWFLEELQEALVEPDLVGAARTAAAGWGQSLYSTGERLEQGVRATTAAVTAIGMAGGVTGA